MECAQTIPTKVEQLDVPLERDVFLRSLIRELSGTLQDVVGLEEASGFVSVVGQRIGDQINQKYTAALGLVSDERGLSLRFPRFLKVREDKSIDEATTSDYLAYLWRKQSERTKQEGGEPLAEEQEE